MQCSQIASGILRYFPINFKRNILRFRPISFVFMCSIHLLAFLFLDGGSAKDLWADTPWDGRFRQANQVSLTKYSPKLQIKVCISRLSYLQKKKGRKTGLHIECVTPYKGRYRMLIKYCVISNILKYIPDSGIYR